MPAIRAPTSKISIERYGLPYQIRALHLSTLKSIQVSSCKYPRLKEVDDVLGGAAAWENVDTTDGELVLSNLKSKAAPLF